MAFDYLWSLCLICLNNFVVVRELKPIRLKMQLVLHIGDPVERGTFPSEWGGAYLVRAGEFIARHLGICEGQRYQSSTWNFRPYKTHLSLFYLSPIPSAQRTLAMG